MLNNFRTLMLAIFLCGCFNAKAQNTPILKVTDTVSAAYNPNRPATAAFYSAVLPGLGQIYNRDYWRAPVVWAGLGTTIYIFVDRQNEYLQLREAYRSRLAGRRDDRYIDDEGNEILSTDGLERAQETAQKNKELALLITAAWYLLNIVEANVSAHLDSFNTDRNLSVLPLIDYGNLTYTPSYGLTISYTF